MAYSELIKNFSKIREYMRDFYVYGFRTRGEFDRKSARSYDNERRRIESWLGDYMAFRQTESGKNVFISVDSRDIGANPLFKAFKAKSFTDKDITLFFYVMDLLEDACGAVSDDILNGAASGEISVGVVSDDIPAGAASGEISGEENYGLADRWRHALNASEIYDGIVDNYLSEMELDPEFDLSTLRKKLKEFEELGLVASKKVGNKQLYVKNSSAELDELLLTELSDAIRFFAETAPLGVIGSYISDRNKQISDGDSVYSDDGIGEGDVFAARDSLFAYKHHYILEALDSEILYQVIEAMNQKCVMEVTVVGRTRPSQTAADKRENDKSENGKPENSKSGDSNAVVLTVCPMQVIFSTGQGRYYVAVYNLKDERFHVIRLDNVKEVRIIEEKNFSEGKGVKVGNAVSTGSLDYDKYKADYVEFKKHMWGVSVNPFGRIEHVEMDIRIAKDEAFMVNRLNREKRCGHVRQIDETTWRYYADVYDALEMLPWIRTFTGRILRFESDNTLLKKRLYEDLDEMYRMYGVDGG